MDFILPYIHNGSLSFTTAAIISVLTYYTWKCGNTKGAIVNLFFVVLNVVMGINNVLTH